MDKPALPSSNKCCGCSACFAACPVDAIAMVQDKEGFLNPAVHPERCIKCGKCAAVCPVVNKEESRLPIEVLATRAKDIAVRLASSSGGVFALAAQEIIKRGGVVFGAAFDYPDARVVHKKASSLEELDDFKGSKYVQSDMGNTFRNVKTALQSGQDVLFSGCPCQIAGLKNYLGVEYNNLFTVDIICHGVPSPKAWNEYIHSREREAGSSIANVVMRRYGPWRSYPIEMRFANTSAGYRSSVADDTFLRGFFEDFFLRKCCHKCPVRSLRSGSDLTIGDYWDVSTLPVNIDDDTGISAVLINTPKGHTLFDCILPFVESFPSSYKVVSNFNPTLETNYPQSGKRALFFKKVGKVDFDALVLDLCRPGLLSIIHKLLWWMKRLIVNGEINKL